MHIHRVEARFVEGPRHLYLAVNALLTQHGHRWLGGVDKGRADIVVDIESRRGAEARVANVEQVVELVLRTFRVIP